MFSGIHWGSFELFLKRTVKGAQTFKSTVKAELRDCIIGIFKSLTCISQPGIIQVLVEVLWNVLEKILDRTYLLTPRSLAMLSSVMECLKFPET